MSHMASATVQKTSASAAGWPPGAFKSYFVYSVSQKHTHQISLMSHTKPHGGKTRSAATARVWLRQEMWSTRTGHYSARAGGEIQTRLTVIGMWANVGLRCRLEASSADGWLGSSEFQVVNINRGFSCLRGGVCLWNSNNASLKCKKLKCLLALLLRANWKQPSHTNF